MSDAPVAWCTMIVPAPLVFDWEPDAPESETGCMSARLGDRRIARSPLSLSTWIQLLPVRKWLATQRVFELTLLARAEAPGVHGHLLVRFPEELESQLQLTPRPASLFSAGLLLGVLVRYEADYTHGGDLVSEVVSLLDAVVQGRGEPLVDRQLRKWNLPEEPA